MSDSGGRKVQPFGLHLLRRKDVLAGVMFIGVAVLGLWASRNYPIGTSTRMSTGYVPRLLCWILLGLGALVIAQGLRAAAAELEPGRFAWRPILLVPAALLAFAFTIGSGGVVAATVAVVAIGGLASRASRPLEVAVAAIGLVLLTLAIFVWGVGLPLQVWPEW